MKEVIVKLGKYKGLEIPKADTGVTEEEIQTELRNACECAAKRRVKGDDEPAEMGDSVVLDFCGYIDGKPFDGGSSMGAPLTLGSGRFIPGFEEQLVGAKKDQPVDVIVAFPEDYQAAEYAGRDATFKCVLRRIETLDVPELSDEVIARVSNYRTVEEFIAFLKEEISSSKQQLADQDLQNYLLQKVVEDSEIEIPEEAIVNSVENLKQELMNQLKGTGHTYEEYLEYNHLTEEKFEEQGRQNAIFLLQGRCTMLELAQEEGLTVSDRELNEELAEMGEEYRMNAEGVRDALGEEGLKKVKDDLLASKALQFVVDHAVEVEEPEAE